MTETRAGPAWSETPITLAQLKGRLSNLAYRLSRLEEEADELASMVGEMLKEPENQNLMIGGLPGSNRSKRRRSLDTDLRNFLRKEALVGVQTVQILYQSDGYVLVSIDGKDPFTLSPKLGILLSILSMDLVEEPSPDTFVPWKTTAQIAKLLLQKTGSPAKKHALTNSIYLLRNQLFHEHGVNPYLVQTSPNGAYRFAVKSTKVSDRQ